MCPGAAVTLVGLVDHVEHLPELIEPGKPQQNGIHERTLKQEATVPSGSCMRTQQGKFDTFHEEYKADRPHEALQIACPADVYHRSAKDLPSRMASPDFSHS